jgi:hypothetical protein
MADDTYIVERSATINAPAERIYAQIVDFHNWPAWSPWEDLDPELERSYSGTSLGTGSVYAWSGNRKAGKGRMEIIEATQPSLVRIDLAFEKPFKARSEPLFSIEPAGTGSRVNWSITGQKTRIMRLMGVFSSMEKLIGPDLEKGLARLKALTENPAGS